jgi:hypothetical protein
MCLLPDLGPSMWELEQGARQCGSSSTEPETTSMGRLAVSPRRPAATMKATGQRLRAEGRGGGPVARGRAAYVWRCDPGQRKLCQLGCGAGGGMRSQRRDEEAAAGCGAGGGMRRRRLDVERLRVGSVLGSGIGKGS